MLTQVVLDFHFSNFPDLIKGLKIWPVHDAVAQYFLQIPVYRGCKRPLLSHIQHASDYHGKDGLGDVPDPNAPGLELLQKQNAVKAMIKIAKKYPGEVGQVFTFANQSKFLLYWFTWNTLTVQIWDHKSRKIIASSNIFNQEKFESIAAL